MAALKARDPQGDDAFPTKQLAVLAVCRLAEPIAFTSIIAYTYPMVKGFQGSDDTNAEFYAGLLVSAFAVAEACTAMTWGTISDRYGRKPIILTGLAGTALSSLVFGFATNFWVALGARVIGGLLNGNVAVMQTMIAEMCKKPEWEPRAYTMPSFMWSLGMIIGAAMGGFLAQPAHYYPSVFSHNGLFGKYPYLLPNLVAVGFILLAVIQGYIFLEETNPRFQPPPWHAEDDDNGSVDEYTPLQPSGRRESAIDSLSTGGRRPSFNSGSMPTMSEPSFDLRRGSVTTLHEIKPVVPTIERAPDQDGSDPHVKAFNRSVIMWIIALVIMSYYQMAFGSLLPIYLQDEPQKSNSIDLQGGLGYTVHDVGTFMSVYGVIALIIQATIAPMFIGRVGIWKSLVCLLTLCPITYILVPFLSMLPRSGLQVGVYAILTLHGFFLIIIYPCLLIALKNATASSLVLGKVNGLAMSACSGARTISPPLVGIIYGTGGSAAAWWSIAAVALSGSIELCLIARPKDADVVVVNVLRRESTIQSSNGRLHDEDDD